MNSYFLGWNTKISARESNYGTRIDLILITPRLIPWISAADIQPHIKGSDHCPVFVDFRDEITDANGITIKLQDVLGVQAAPPGAAKEPPRLAAKFWDEHSGKQTLLENFFGRQPADTPSLDQSSTPSMVSDTSTAAEAVAKPPPPQGSKSLEFINSPSSSTTTPASPTSKRKITVETSNSSKRLKPKNGIAKPKEKNPGKQTIASFFSQPKTRNSQTTASLSTVSKGKDKVIGTPLHAENDVTPSDSLTLTQADEDADYRLALLLSSQDSITSSSQCRLEKESKQAWNNLLAPIQPPKCLIHRELAKELTVTKQGPNKGKKFFICSR